VSVTVVDSHRFVPIEEMENALNKVDLRPYKRIVQMFWDPEPTNDTTADLPAWCLGKSYQLSHHSGVRSKTGEKKLPSSDWKCAVRDEEHAAESGANETTSETPYDSTPSSFSSALAYEDPSQLGRWPQGFIDDFEARFWMTYRSDFVPIRRSADPKALHSMSFPMRLKTQFGGDHTVFTSDTGWGCMIRSGQSLLANAFGLQWFGRDWRRGSRPEDEKKLIQMFADDPRAPFSLHRFVEKGASVCGKFPGEWFGPSATARCIKELVASDESPLQVYSTGDGHDVYEDRFMEVAKPNGRDFLPTLVLVGTRLGIETITPVYWEALIAALQMPQSVGIAGGRPSSAHYFAGAQGSYLFYLDPHHTRTALPYHDEAQDYTPEEIDSCHTNRLRRVHVREMDPSMLIAFLIQSEDDWLDWRKCVKHVQGKAIIHVADRNPTLEGSCVSEGRPGAIDEVEPLSDDEDDALSADSR